MKNWSIWHWLLAIGGGSVVFLLCYGFISAVGQKGIGSGEAASWLQAIGSILAIVAAFAISTRQHNAERALDVQRQRLNDIRRLKAAKAVLVQICTVTQGLHKAIKSNDAEQLYNFDPQFLADYKAVLQSLPLFEIPSSELVLYINTSSRAIDEVTARMFEARKQDNHPVLRYEWLLAHDIEEKVENLHNLATTANNHCFERVKYMGGWTAEELAVSSQK